jgi:hypothetical protein
MLARGERGRAGDAVGGGVRPVWRHLSLFVTGLTKGENQMSRRFTRALIGGAAALGIGLFAALPSALPATAATTGRIPTIKPGHALYDVGVHSDVTRAEAASATASFSFTHYTSSVKVGTKSYTYTIAGKNPAKTGSNSTTSIKVDLIPLIMNFSGGPSWNPTKTDSCDSGASALTRTQNSPIFKNATYTWGGTKIGTSQVTDAYQRADFWKYAKPTGINPKFGVTFSLTTLSPVTINVPAADQATGAIGCGNGLLGATDINWLDPFLQSTVIPSLASKGVGPGVLPVFLLHNFVEYISTTTNCCVLGYHNAYNTSSGVQTYGLAMYDNSGAFQGSSDISALSHEVAEWQNDPSTVNPTPSWGHIGQVTGCQANLEVGDPLSGTTFKVSLNGFTYHPQQLAFFSWFYHQKPSLGVNGWYSDQGTFKTPAANCT